MTKSKNRKTKPSENSPKPVPSARERARKPAWKSRIGLIIGFFAITIGGSYIVLFQAMAGRGNVRVFGFKEVARYPHDSQAFTEGLLYHEGKIYESTGLQDESTLRHMDLKTQQVVIEKIDPKYFGEGLALWQDRLIQLTYNSGVALCYDLDFNRLDQQFEYEGQGWGLTHDGRHLIMSNGTSQLQFRNPDTFELSHRLTVYDGRWRVGQLNELEYVNGKIYANVWHKDYILEIDPSSGQVTGRIDLSGLFPYAQRPSSSEAVLNGIAFNSDTNRFIVTGKYWPYLFEIELVLRDAK